MNFSFLSALKCNHGTLVFFFCFVFIPVEILLNKPTRHLLGICIHNQPSCTNVVSASVVSEKVFFLFSSSETRKTWEHILEFACEIQITPIILVSSTNASQKVIWINLI